jgi:hypothetical protein
VQNWLIFNAVEEIDVNPFAIRQRRVFPVHRRSSFAIRDEVQSGSPTRPCVLVTFVKLQQLPVQFEL